jgi:hypothetical protein
VRENRWKPGPDSTTVRIVVVVLVWAAYAVLIINLNSLDIGHPSATAIWIACLMGMIATLCAVLANEHESGQIDRITYGMALRTGKLPAEIEPDVWRRRLRRGRLSNWLAWLAGCTFVGFGLASSVGSRTAYREAFTAVFSLLALSGFVMGIRSQARLGQLEDEVKRRKRRLGAAATGRREGATAADKHYEAMFQMPLAQPMATDVVIGFIIAFLPLLVANLDLLSAVTRELQHSDGPRLSRH